MAAISGPDYALTGNDGVIRPVSGNADEKKPGLRPVFLERPA